MLTSGDVVMLGLGTPRGREAGLVRPAVVITAQRVLDQRPSTVHVVPLTSTLRRFGSEVAIAPDRANGLDAGSSAQCQHLRSVSVERVEGVQGNVGAAITSQLRDVVAMLLDLPA